MARLTIHELLTELQTKLSTEYGISAITRYYFVGDIAELPTEPAYFLEPGTLTINRINVAAPEVVQTVRFLWEGRFELAPIASIISEQVALFERIARDFMREPIIADGRAFLRGVSTFSDAPSTFSVSQLEDGVPVVTGGIELAFSIA